MSTPTFLLLLLFEAAGTDIGYLLLALLAVLNPVETHTYVEIQVGNSNYPDQKARVGLTDPRFLYPYRLRRFPPACADTKSPNQALF